ncbi:YbaB/EbfC family nucleoid-associated protein [Streptomyces milbemycinicus]|uniref:YbaB/EbfC family nucleoid-associated protein n=1 Tax=Streptomyces milbemycinicus TaxID=476552 RepID=A0ABW8LPK1_9ACTN
MSELNDPYAERIHQARAHLEATRAAIARAEQDLTDHNVTARSRDRAVEVTIGPQGELAGLTFLDNKYLNMTGPQLAASVLEAAQRGRQQVAQRVMDTFRPLMAANPDVPGSRDIDIDWDRLFGSAFEGGRRVGGGRPSNDRLRDEIHEDPDVPGGRP